MAKATCEDCNTAFEMPRPSYGDMVSWACTECGGRLELEIACEQCREPNTRTTGWKAMYTRWSRPGTCDQCGYRIGFQNSMPGEFSGRYGQRPLRLLLAVLFGIYVSAVTFVFTLLGMIGGAIIGGAGLLALGVVGGTIGLELAWWRRVVLSSGLLIGVGGSIVYGIRYSFVHFDAVVSKGDGPEPIEG